MWGRSPRLATLERLALALEIMVPIVSKPAGVEGRVLYDDKSAVELHA